MRRSVTSFLLLLLVGCAVASHPRQGTEIERSFFRQSTSAQQKSFRSYPLDEQLVLFHYGNQVRHPPALYLARCFALNGESGVRLLQSEKLGARSDLDVRDFIVLLAAIDRMNMYDVPRETQFIADLKGRVSRFADADWREYAEKRIASFGRERERGVAIAPNCK